MSFFIDPRTLPANLTYLMSKEKGLNPTSLSIKTGVPQPTIQRVLKGKSKEPRASTVDPIAKYFNVPAHLLLCVDLEAAERNPGGPEGAYADKVTRDIGTVAEMDRLLEVIPRLTTPSPGTATPAPLTVSSLLDQLKDEIADLPEPLRQATSELVLQYLKTPDAETGQEVAQAIERIINKRA